MHLVGHVLSALPLLAVGAPWAAAGALLPDLTWIGNELRYRKARHAFLGDLPWQVWINAVEERRITPYRIAHSLFAPLAASMLPFEAAHSIALGWAMHLLLDWPTHSGRMLQQPLYPLPWRWRWILKK